MLNIESMCEFYKVLIYFIFCRIDKLALYFLRRGSRIQNKIFDDSKKNFEIFIYLFEINFKHCFKSSKKVSHKFLKQYVNMKLVALIGTF